MDYVTAPLANATLCGPFGESVIGPRCEAGHTSIELPGAAMQDASAHHPRHSQDRHHGSDHEPAALRDLRGRSTVTD